MRKHYEAAFKLLPWLGPTLVCAYFLPALVRGQVFFSVDTIGWTYVLRRWWVDGLLHGMWRLWNPSHFGGMYLPASPGIGIFSLLNLIFAVDNSPRVMQWMAMLSGCLGSFGMYFLIQRVTRNRPAAIFASIAYPLSGYVLSSVHNYGFFAGACIYPWALWGFFRGGYLFPALLAAIVFEGDPFGAFAIGIFCLVHGAGRRRETFFGVVLAVAFSAVAWLPGLFSASETMRSVSFPYTIATLFSLSPRQLWQWISPAHWGFFNDLSFHADFSDAVDGKRFWVDSVYLGLIPLAAGLFAIRKNKKLAALCLLLLLIAMGRHGGIYPLLYDLLPGWDRLRYPSRFYAFFNLAFCCLAAWGMSRVPSRWAFGLILFTAADLFFRAPPMRLVPLETLTADSGVRPLLETRGNPNFRFLRDGGIDFNRGLNPSRESLADNWPTLEGIRSVFGYDPTQPKRLFPLMNSEIFRYLESWKRVLGVEYVLAPNMRKLPWTKVKEWPERKLALWQSPTASLAFEVFTDIRTVPNARLALQAVKERGGASFAILETPYTAELKLDSTAKFRFVPGDAHALEYNADKPVLLVLRDRFHPEWHAWVGEKELKIYRADFLNPAVILPAGHHTLRYEFRPVSFFLGLAVSGLSMLSVLAVIFLKRPKKYFQVREWAWE